MYIKINVNIDDYRSRLPSMNSLTHSLAAMSDGG